MVLYQCRGNPNHDKCKAESTELGRCEKSPLDFEGFCDTLSHQSRKSRQFLAQKKKTKPLYFPPTPLVFLSVV